MCIFRTCKTYMLIYVYLPLNAVCVWWENILKTIMKLLSIGNSSAFSIQFIEIEKVCGFLGFHYHQFLLR